MINVFIKGQSLKVVAPVIVSDSIKYLDAKFHFQTSDWDGFSKWAHFSKGDIVYDIRLNEDDGITKTDNLNLSAGEWAVYIHGTSADGTRITTEKAFIEVKESGVLDGKPFPDVPLTAFEQLDNRVAELEKGDVDNGSTGKDGGYYIPTVEQVGEDFARFYYKASKKEMPEVPAFDVALPRGKDGETPDINVGRFEEGGDVEAGAIIDICYKNECKSAKIYDGKDGKTAYQIALENGFVGTEKEWLDSLHGSASIPDGAVTPEKTSFIKKTAGTGPQEVPNFTNLADPASDDWTSGKWQENSTSIKDDADCCITNLIPCKSGDVLRFKGIVDKGIGAAGARYLKIQPFDASKNALTSGLYVSLSKDKIGNGIAEHVNITDDGVYEYTCFKLGDSQHSYASRFEYVRISGAVLAGEEDIIVTVNEPITYTQQEVETVGYALDKSIAVPKAEENSVEIEAIKNSIKSGARWFALGDSITEGYISYLDEAASSGYGSKINKTKCWVTLLAAMNGYELTNYGVGGTGYLRNSDANARVLVDTIDFTKCDFVTLAYGVNDWKYAVNIGTVSDIPQTEIVRNTPRKALEVTIDMTNGVEIFLDGVLLVADTDYTIDGIMVTFTTPAPVGSAIDVYTATPSMVSNMAYTIKRILRSNPLCKIFVITPINCRSLGHYVTNWGINYAGDAANNLGLEDIFELQKAVCNYYGIELIDMTHSSIVNRENIVTMLADYVHPTEDAHKMMARELSKKISFK